jgi:hypothetical protein
VIGTALSAGIQTMLGTIGGMPLAEWILARLHKDR